MADMIYDDGQKPHGDNTPEFSVSELSFTLKRTIEDTFGHVRVRGEISRVTVARSGHIYTALKDDKAVLDSVIWKGVAGRLSIKPEEGMEVVCTGRLTTYPGRSNYQLVVESMELAGEGALLKLLEERRKRLAAEGLFDEDRKKPLPFLPETIGVITSDTGAVIRDIMHRLRDRFPRHVLLWPVLVQGEKAAEQVAAAISGFNRLEPPHRPDVLIVARGGGSLEDLMPFNDEAVVRAAAASDIPLISAVGHETDTTLIDHAADRRAPTPTGAAEIAVPVRTELMAGVLDMQRRSLTAMRRGFEERRHRVEGLGRGLLDPKRRLENAMQRLDDLESRLRAGLRAYSDRQSARLDRFAAGLRPPRQLIDRGRDRLATLDGRIRQSVTAGLRERSHKLHHLASLLGSLSHENILQRGFALVRGDDGRVITAGAGLAAGAHVKLVFHDTPDGLGAVIGETGPATPRPGQDANPAAKAPKRKNPAKAGESGGQGSLF